MVLELRQWGKSLIYNKKSKGPRIEPWGTPHVIGKLEDKYPQYVTNNCFEVELTDDQLVFDYKLKTGISQKLNASFLMKKMGIMD